MDRQSIDQEEVNSLLDSYTRIKEGTLDIVAHEGEGKSCACQKPDSVFAEERIMA